MTLHDFVGPSYETRSEFMDQVKNIAYYIMIGLVSLLMMFVVPLFAGSLAGDYKLYFPETVEAWIIYIIMRTANCIGNIAMFIFFKLQAKTNVRKDPNYIEAAKLMSSLKGRKAAKPRSPGRMNFEDYSIKIVSLIVMTLVTTVTITALVIAWDLVSFISMVVAVLVGILFGWTTMIQNEEYWTHEYLLYAKEVTNGNND